MNFLRVWITLPSGEAVHLGELAFGDMGADGRSPTAFRYSADWLQHAQAFSLTPDTQDLPLSTREFHASHLGFPLMVFNDALPDAWGQRVIVAVKRLARHQQTPFYFMQAVAGGGLGALSFNDNDVPPPRQEGINAAISLEQLASAAIAFDNGETLADPALNRLYAAGATPGGARPKVLVTDADNTSWLVKLPSARFDGHWDVVGLEATCLKLAQEAGLQTPDLQLVQLGKRRALMVKRFDITPNGGRCHMISLSTLCREGAGTQAVSYNDPADAIRKYSDDPQDVVRFFKQMVFNAAIGNTDDHLKNFLLLRNAQGYRLSPAYDLVPNIGQNFEHVLAMGYSAMTPDRNTLRAVAKQWQINPARAMEMVDEVIAAVNRFDAVAAGFDIDAASVEHFNTDILRRTVKLNR